MSFPNFFFDIFKKSNLTSGHGFIKRMSYLFESDLGKCDIIQIGDTFSGFAGVDAVQSGAYDFPDEQMFTELKNCYSNSY